jgi:predicted RNA binding protein YcfA (HicA-like mRNA interferase family)
MSPRLIPVKRQRLVAVLQMNGLELVPGRGKGSHAWYEHPHDPSRHTAVPDRREISGRLLAAILTQAGKTREEFFARLREV